MRRRVTKGASLKTIIGILVGILAITPSAEDGNAQATRCLGVQPICPPGKHPICLCESDISLRCGWVCAAPGVQ